MNKFKSKKGFTLAELLIVVAIIAVLVAIAVPLFVGAVSKAEETTKNANIRAVRGEAVAIILMDEGEKFTKVDGKKAIAWTVTAEVNSTGDVKINKIVPSDSKVEGTDGATKSGGTYTVTVYINQEDLSKIAVS